MTGPRHPGMRIGSLLTMIALSSLRCAAGSFAPASPHLEIPGVNASGVPWTIVLLLTLLTLLPALLLSMTPLVRLLVVFHFLRQALGTQSAPTNQTLIGLSLVLTYFLMQPVGLRFISRPSFLWSRTRSRPGRRLTVAPSRCGNTC